MSKKDIDKDKKKNPTPENQTEDCSAAGRAAEEPAADNPPAEKNETELLREEFDALNDRYLRLMAEYDNFRKRSQKEKDDIYPNATASAVQKFLPVLDSLERAAGFERATEEFAKGFDMIMQSFRDVLAALGVEEVGTEGETFDPAFHNAAMHIEDENFGENVVSQVFQKGYKIGDKVLRYAMVQTAN